MKWHEAIGVSGFHDPFVADTEDLKGFDAEDFRRGRRIRSWDPAAWYKAVKRRNDGALDDVLCEGLYIPVYSARLREALDRAGIEGIQYLPVRVFRPNGSEIKGYAIANFLHAVSALDAERTEEVMYFPDDFPNPHARGKIEGIRGLVLRASRLEGRDVIRLRESLLRVYVSDRFRGVFKEGGFTGYAFRRVKVA